jgi:hypothetical protein
MSLLQPLLDKVGVAALVHRNSCVPRALSAKKRCGCPILAAGRRAVRNFAQVLDSVVKTNKTAWVKTRHKSAGDKPRKCQSLEL